MHTYTPADSIFFNGHDYNKSTFSTVHFDRNPFTCSYKSGKKEEDLNDLKFGTFIGRFPRDGAACMAVKGLSTTVE